MDQDQPPQPPAGVVPALAGVLVTKHGQFISAGDELGSDLSWALGGEFADISLRVGEGSDARNIHAHKVFLAARSPFFRALIEMATERKDGKLQLTFPNEAPSLFRRLINFLYTGRVEVDTPFTFIHLVTLADRFGVSALVKAADAEQQKHLLRPEGHLMKGTSVLSVIAALRAAPRLPLFDKAIVWAIQAVTPQDLLEDIAGLQAISAEVLEEVIAGAYRCTDLDCFKASTKRRRFGGCCTDDSCTKPGCWSDRVFRRVLRQVDLFAIEPSDVESTIEPCRMVPAETVLNIYRAQALAGARGEVVPFRSTRGALAFDPDCVVKGGGTDALVFSGDNFSVVFEGGDVSKSGDIVVSSAVFGSGYHRFEFRVEADCDADEGTTDLFVGLLGGDLSEVSWLGGQAGGWAVGGEGKVVHQPGKSIPDSLKGLKDGDVVLAELDMANRCCAFSLLEPADDTIKWKVAVEGLPPIVRAAACCASSSRAADETEGGTVGISNYVGSNFGAATG